MKEILQKLICREDLTAELARDAFEAILSGEVDPAVIGAFLAMLAQKGETVIEITAGMEVLNSKAKKLNAPEGAIDIVGTGGDNLGSYNISTNAAIITAATGVPVAKHGNHAVSSKSGAANVLSALGVNIEAPIEVMQNSLDEINLAFMFAPLYHQAVGNVKNARQKMGIRTIFNFLGPVCNPANVKRILLGVSERRLLKPFAEVLVARGFERFMIVNGDNNMDEISLSTPTAVMAYDGEKLNEMTMNPEHFGLEKIADEASLQGGTPTENAKMIIQILEGAGGAVSDLVLMNSAAALWVAGKVENPRAGVALAKEVIASGAARKKLSDFVAITNR